MIRHTVTLSRMRRADNNKAISDLQHQNTADGHGVQLIRYCFITYHQFNSRKSERVGE